MRVPVPPSANGSSRRPRRLRERHRARTRRRWRFCWRQRAPPSGRVVLVNGLEAWLIRRRHGRRVVRTLPPGRGPSDGAARVDVFMPDPWPRWTFTLPDGASVEHGGSATTGRRRSRSIGRRTPPPRHPLVPSPPSPARISRLAPRKPRLLFDACGHRVVWRPYAACPRSSLAHSTAPTATIHSGISDSSTAKSGLGASTTSKIWRRRACFAGTSPRARRS